MREWLRARWRSVALVGALVLAFVVVALQYLRDVLTTRKDARTDRRLEREHEAHVAHEARAQALDEEAREVEAREKQLREQGQMDFGGMSADEVAAAFRRIAEREKNQ